MPLNDGNKVRRKWLGSLRRGLRWVIPALVFYVVFRRIDLAAFRSSLAQTNPWLAALGMGLYPVVILTAALRWYLLLRLYHGRQVTPGTVVRRYWTGIALGTFGMGSLGLDLYRVVTIGYLLGQYSLNAAIIAVEKLISLVACMLFIVIMYPLVPIAASPQIEQVSRLAYILLFVSVLLMTGTGLALRNRVVSILLARLEAYTARILQRIGSRVGLEDQSRDAQIPFRAVMEPLTMPTKLMPALLMSVGMQLMLALRAQVFFQAVGYDLPFIINLFVSPVVFFIASLPITIAGLGTGAAILLYVLFGVPTEVALLVTSLSIIGQWIAQLIGGSLLLVTNAKGDSVPEAAFRRGGENHSS